MAGAESPGFSAIIMLCDSVACPALPGEGEPAPAIDGTRPQDLAPAGCAIPGALNIVMVSPLRGHR